MMQLRTGLLPLLVVLLSRTAYCQRIIIAHDTIFGPLIRERAQKLGLSIVGEAKSLLVLEGRAQGAARDTRAQSVISRALRWPGVVAVEQDQPRYMHRPFRASNKAQSGPGAGYQDCTLLDKPISNGTWPEYQPYGLSMIQATSSKLPNSTSGSGVVVCVIDSGMDSKHPDLIQNSLDGCKYEDSFAAAGEHCSRAPAHLPTEVSTCSCCTSSKADSSNSSRRIRSSGMCSCRCSSHDQ